ncbi:hypothetical protein Hanom_Chr13g01244731 [Helianthus anomalus]
MKMKGIRVGTEAIRLVTLTTKIHCNKLFEVLTPNPGMNNGLVMKFMRSNRI